MAKKRAGTKPAKKAKKAKKAKAVRQDYIDGFAPKRIKEIDAAAISYLQLRNERMLMLEEEVTAKQALLAVMQKHSLEEYRIPDSDQEVLRTHGDEGVKVRKRRAEDDGTQA